MKNFLIASSSPSFLDRNENLLKRAEFNMMRASTIAEVREIVKNTDIDLLLLDLHLTDASGEECCRSVRALENGNACKVLLVCNDDAATFERLRFCGADAFIPRPIKPLQLIKTVGQFLTVQLVRSKRVPFRVKVISQKDAVEFFGVSHNLSLTGLLMETEHPLAEGDVIDCQFTIPDSIAVELRGEVARSLRTIDGAYQYGIHFTATTRAFREAADHYIAEVSHAERLP